MSFIKSYISKYNLNRFSKFEKLNIIASLYLKLAAINPIATNLTLSERYPEGLFSPGETPETYLSKIIPQYEKDIFDKSFEKFKRNFLSQNVSEEQAEHLAKEKIKEIASKQATKSVMGHTEFLKKLKELGVEPGSVVISPGSGSGTETVLAPDILWRGLEYQKNAVSLYNDKARQMNLPAKAYEWSFLRSDPEQPLGEDWESKLNTFPEEITTLANAMYAKHACGGITDFSIWRASKDRIPKMLIATCCAARYPEVSWRILKPTNDDGSPMSLQEYSKLARHSQAQDEEGRKKVQKIDSFREKFLKSEGYNVERGITSFGPYIKAWL